VALNVRDLFKRPLSEDELRALATLAPVSELFSWKSPTARQRGITPGSRSDVELIALMAAEPRLIRRPLIVADGRLTIGAHLSELMKLA